MFDQQLALKRIEEVKSKKLTRLDLSSCDLRKLPYELSELIWIEELNLNNCKYIHDFSLIESLINLKTLVLGGIKRVYLNIGFIEKLPNLESIDLRESTVRDWTPLKYALKLKTLDVSFTEIENLSPLEGLTQLEDISFMYGYESSKY